MAYVYYTDYTGLPYAEINVASFLETFLYLKYLSIFYERINAPTRSTFKISI
jgi:hypothetical protein